MQPAVQSERKVNNSSGADNREQTSFESWSTQSYPSAGAVKGGGWGAAS